MTSARPTRIGASAAALAALTVCTIGTSASAAVPYPDEVILSPADGATGVSDTSNLTIDFGSPIQAGSGNVTLLQTTPVTLLEDTLDDTSLLTVTTGSFFADVDPAFAPDGIFGRNDGAGGGDFGGDTPGDRTAYSGFSGGFLEATGVAFGGTNPVVVEWQNIDITGATYLEFSADFASALMPDENDWVRVEAIIDGGGAQPVLEFSTEGLDSTFEASDTGQQLSSSARSFARPITGTGTTLTLRVTISLSGVSATGDDIAIDNVTVAGNDGAPTLVEQAAVSAPNVTLSGSMLSLDPAAVLAPNTHYSVLVDEGAVTDTEVTPASFAGLTVLSAWDFTTGDAGAPQMLSLSPADDTTDAPVDSNLSIIFDRSITAVFGDITLHRASDDAVVQTFDVTTDASVSTTNVLNDTVMINPSADLDFSTDYYVLIDSGAFEASVTPFSDFPGFSSTTEWNFTTDETPSGPGTDGEESPSSELPETGPANALPAAVLAAALSAAGGALLLRSRRLTHRR
ncbi:Ig-like domain-containing protein [Demequina sp. NBRC 110052]|uniref:Ig-like domain-containing protein n=1 Tax=Demequina sp. NBRC 110052 TaxID=1570341 RepID=UPI00117E7244|nr:Ig-like domain-containing protein [Demequina sp. NBRC 110052]